jgi:hypothetical protein
MDNPITYGALSIEEFNTAIKIHFNKITYIATKFITDDCDLNCYYMSETNKMIGAYNILCKDYCIYDKQEEPLEIVQFEIK